MLLIFGPSPAVTGKQKDKQKAELREAQQIIKATRPVWKRHSIFGCFSRHIRVLMLVVLLLTPKS